MPTINLISGYDDLSPVNKEIWSIYNSGSASTLTDFRYFFTVFAKNEPFGSNLFTRLQTYKLPPRPDNSNAEYSPHRIIKSLFAYDIDPCGTGWMTASDGLVQFKLGYGFEYNPNATYSFTFNTGGFMTLGTLFNSSAFQVGDIIFVEKDNKQINISYDGTCSVTSIPLGTSLVTDKPFGVTTSIVESGKITNLTRRVGTSSNGLAYNGTRQYLERTVNFTDTFLMTSTTSNAQFLTNYDTDIQNKSIYLNPGTFSGNECETLSMILGTTSGFLFAIDRFTAGSGLTPSTDYFTLSVANNYQRMEFGVGTSNLLELTNDPTWLDNTLHYDCYVTYAANIVVSYIIPANPILVTFTLLPAGTFNGKNYYTWSDFFNTYYIWFDNLADGWVVGSALGGGTSWLTSISTGSNNQPPEGILAVQYFPTVTPLPFIRFNLRPAQPPISEKFRFKINNKCTQYERVRLMWLNRHGGWDYYTFTKDSKKTLEVQRTQYTKTLKWDYAVGDRGDTILAQKGKENYLINSDWVTEYEAEWMQELFSSPEVYHLSGTDKLPVVILDNTYTVQTYLRDQIFNIQVNYRYAYNVNLQNE